MESLERFYESASYAERGLSTDIPVVVFGKERGASWLAACAVPLESAGHHQMAFNSDFEARARIAIMACERVRLDAFDHEVIKHPGSVSE